MIDGQPIKLTETQLQVSIILCTLNRAESLRSTLESIGRAAVPSGWNVELLVVDNGSTDHTRAVVSETRLRNIVLHYLSEPMTGKCYALNSALSGTTGEILLLTDDDVRVPHNWIEGMCSPILNRECDAVAGGVVFPPHIAAIFSRPPLSKLKSWYASTYELNPDFPARMVGANMAFGRHVLSKVPEFDPELGVGQIGSGEETLFSALLLRQGFRIKGALNIAIEHHFDTQRLGFHAILNLARQIGESDGFISWHFRHKKHPCNYIKLFFIKMIVYLGKRLSMVIPGNGTDYPPYWEIAYMRKIGYRERYMRETRRKQKY